MQTTAASTDYSYVVLAQTLTGDRLLLLLLLLLCSERPGTAQ
jgi:hypothetical protein